MKHFYTIAILLAWNLSLSTAPAQQDPRADLVLKNGHIVTLDEHNPVARKHNTAAALLAATDAVMDRETQLPGAKDLAGAF